MSLSSYIRRQSLVSRLRKNSVSTTTPLTSIQEEPRKQTASANLRNNDTCYSESSGDDAESIETESSSGEESSGLPTTPTSMESYPITEAHCEDDDFYAGHAADYLTFAAPLSPASSILSPITTRESAVLPASLVIRPSHQLDPTYSVWLSRSKRLPSIVTSVAARPPPRTRVPSDVTLTDYVASSPHSASSAVSPASSLAALLSPPPPRFPTEVQGIPSDVYDEDEGEWEDECDAAYDEIPLSPLLTVSGDDEPRPHWSSFPTPPLLSVPNLPPSLASPSPASLSTFPPSPPSPSPSVSKLPTPSPAHSPEPQLRSRWSSSTLDSVHAAHAASTTAHKTFGSLARRYLPSPKSPSLSVSFALPPSAPPRRGAAVRTKRGKPKLKPLTVADVRVVRPEPAPASAEPTAFTSVPLTPASSSFSSGSSAPAPPPVTPYSATAQYASYPSQSPSPSPSRSSYAAAYAYPTQSPALTKAYITQRSPRRRRAASNVSLAPASAWSSSSSGSSSAGSDAGGSECSLASSGSASGLRRKPIPVEMFLRG